MGIPGYPAPRAVWSALMSTELNAGSAAAKLQSSLAGCFAQ